MINLEHYNLVLFDFDGLLVNTEEIHYRAYIAMCAGRGFELPYTFVEYCQIAHYSAEGLEREIYRLLPQLQQQEPNWKILYREKSEAYSRLIEQGQVSLMPGAEPLLVFLQQNNIDHVVVTHSADFHVSAIKRRHPVLQGIPHWITREDYKEPKPSPECYRAAIKKFGAVRSVIGFEDTPRGLTALMGSTAKPVIVTTIPYPELPHFVAQGAVHLRSLDEVLYDRHN